MADNMHKWQNITQRPPVVTFFQGLFEHVGIRIEDTNESFTAHHRGEQIEFTPDVDDERVEYTVRITEEQVERLAEHAERGEFDQAERYRIIRTLFTPATAATLSNPVLSHRWIRWLTGVEDLTHVYLRSPVDEEADTTHTLICAAEQWIVVPGLHGKPKRVFELSVEDALEYHRRVFAALKENRLGTLWRFGKWYRKWRPSVSRTT